MMTLYSFVTISAFGGFFNVPLIATILISYARGREKLRGKTILILVFVTSIIKSASCAAVLLSSQNISDPSRKLDLLGFVFDNFVYLIAAGLLAEWVVARRYLKTKYWAIFLTSAFIGSVVGATFSIIGHQQ